MRKMRKSSFLCWKPESCECNRIESRLKRKINSVLNRPPGSALGGPSETELKPAQMSLDELLAKAATNSPHGAQRVGSAGTSCCGDGYSDGIRPVEICAIQLGKIQEFSVRIGQRLYGSSNVDTPKGRKGKNTSRTVALARVTILDLNLCSSPIFRLRPTCSPPK